MWYLQFLYLSTEPTTYRHRYLASMLPDAGIGISSAFSALFTKQKKSEVRFKFIGGYKHDKNMISYGRYLSGPVGRYLTVLFSEWSYKKKLSLKGTVAQDFLIFVLIKQDFLVLLKLSAELPSSGIAMSTILKWMQIPVFASIVGKFRYQNKTNLFISQ